VDGLLAKMQTIKLINSKPENIRCECDRNVCVDKECHTITHFKYLITNEYEDDSYWLCKDCLELHFSAIDLEKQI
jgi:hypothetical protein